MPIFHHRRRPRGLTLVEPIVATAVMGALAATVLPRFIDVREHAEATALLAQAGAATSAMVLNQAGCRVTGQLAVEGKCQAVADCAQVAGLLLGGLPAGYAVPPQPLGAAGHNGVEGQCTLLHSPSGEAAVFHGLSAGL